MGSLFVRMPDSRLDQIRAAAGDEEISMTQWVNTHFRNYFKEQDARSCEDGSSHTHSSPPE